MCETEIPTILLASYHLFFNVSLVKFLSAVLLNLFLLISPVVLIVYFCMV